MVERIRSSTDKNTLESSPEPAFIAFELSKGISLTTGNTRRTGIQTQIWTI